MNDIRFNSNPIQAPNQEEEETARSEPRVSKDKKAKVGLIKIIKREKYLIYGV